MPKPSPKLQNHLSRNWGHFWRNRFSGKCPQHENCEKYAKSYKSLQVAKSLTHKFSIYFANETILSSKYFLWKKFPPENCLIRKVKGKFMGRKIFPPVRSLHVSHFWRTGLSKSDTCLFFNFLEKFFREDVLPPTHYHVWKFQPDWSGHLRAYYIRQHLPPLHTSNTKSSLASLAFDKSESSHFHHGYKETSRSSNLDQRYRVAQKRH